MDTILNQITNLLVEPSGSMVYHLVIAFIFISVLQPAMSFIPAGEEGDKKRKRLLLGVSLLVLSRLVIFAASLTAISQQGTASASLGVIELAVLAFDIVVLIWLFAFSTPNKGGDIGLTLFGLGIAAAGAVSAIYWGLQGDQGVFNRSPLALGWQIVILAILLIGIITLYLAKNPASGQGMLMLGIILAGEALQLFISPAVGDYFPLSRLAHLVAFPLTIGLLQNYFIQEDISEEAAPSLTEPEEIFWDLDEADEDPTNIVTAPLDVMMLEEEPKLEREPQGSAKQALPLHLYTNSIAIAGAETPRQICQLFTRLTAHALVADLCLLLTPPDQNGQVHLICGYDLIVQETLQSTSFHSSIIPRYDKLFANRRAVHVVDQGTEKMFELAEILQVKELGNVLVYPVLSEDEQVIAALLLASPYSKHVWDADDQEYLKSASPSINTVLQRALAPHRNERAIETLNQELELSNTDRQKLTEKKDELEAKIEELEATLADASSSKEIEQLTAERTAMLAAIKGLEEDKAALEERVKLLTEKGQALADQHAHLLEEKQELEMLAQTPQETQAQIDALEHANQDLAKRAQKYEQLHKELADRNTTFAKQNETLNVRIKELVEENQRLQGNLKQLEETAPSNGSSDDQEALQQALAQAEEYQTKLAETQETLESLMDFRTQSTNELIPEEQSEVIASISQELRQPLSSITGYTDLLISESVGVLGALQKKFLERVKASTERMNQLIDDLVQVSTLDTGTYLFTVQPVELIGVIDTAIETTSAQFREKEISLRVDIDQNIPNLDTDKDALQQILLYLMQNAGAATPEKGEIMLKAGMYDKTQNDAILLSVTDTGGGISKEELPRVFSRLYRADNPLIEGVGDTGVGLSIAKTLTEALGGRIWVESEEDIGATYSVLLPVISPAVSQTEG